MIMCFFMILLLAQRLRPGTFSDRKVLTIFGIGSVAIIWLMRQYNKWQRHALAFELLKKYERKEEKPQQQAPGDATNAQKEE